MDLYYLENITPDCGTDMKLYDENGKLIAGKWNLCKEIVVAYDEKNPFQHDKIVKDTAHQISKEYNVNYDDVVKTVKLLSGVEL